MFDGGFKCRSCGGYGRSIGRRQLEPIRRRVELRQMRPSWTMPRLGFVASGADSREAQGRRGEC